MAPTIALFVLTAILLRGVGYSDAAHVMEVAVTGHYGVTAAVGGHVDANRATAGLWSSASIVIFFAVAKRRPSE